MLDGPDILQRHEAGLALLAVAICFLGSFVTCFLFAQARERQGQGRFGWVFLAGFAVGAVMWTTHFVGLLAFKPGLEIGFDPMLAGGAFFLSVMISTLGLSVAAFGAAGTGFAGGAIIGLAATAVHVTAVSSMRLEGTAASSGTLIWVGAGLAAACGALALQRARIEGRNVQVVAPVLLACGICVVHFIGMADMMITLDPDVLIPPQAIEPAVLGFFVAAMTMLLVGTGLATTLIARGARLEALTQLRNIADASIEGLILTDGSTILDFNESVRGLVGPAHAARLRNSRIWDVLEHRGIRTLDRFEAYLLTDGDPIPVEVLARQTHTDGAVRRIFAIRDLRERRAAEQRITYLAHFDTLTGLPNRASFQDRLENDIAAASVRDGQLALMILDLDRFKEINDLYGHAAGDELLKATAARITALLSHNEFAARLGGDEFVVVQSGRDQPESAARLAEKLLDVFAKPFALPGQTFQIGLTIGAAIYPRDGDDTRKLLANADLALYRAKAEGRARACFFTPEMDETVRERRVLAQQLAEVIEKDELEIHYQAQAAVPTGEIIGFEALARWNHPVHGYVSPSEFIPIAEETDLILALGECVLRKVCTEAAAWKRPYPVAVNLSVIQFKMANLPDLIHQVLLETGMPASRLELEVTESALIDDLQRALDMLRRIKALGVSIAMDDFGTGYSSLSTLQAFPFDKLKIDKSFVDKIGSRHQSAVIVTAVLGLGRSLQIPVLAEGVENESQRAFLNDALCQQAQGFLFGRPIPLSEIRHIVDADPDDSVQLGDAGVKQTTAVPRQAAVS